MIDPEATKKRIRKKLENTEANKQLLEAYENLQTAIDSDHGILAANRRYRQAGEAYWREASKLWNESIVRFEKEEK